jgi:hypothetical protein
LILVIKEVQAMTKALKRNTAKTKPTTFDQLAGHTTNF